MPDPKVVNLVPANQDTVIRMLDEMRERARKGEVTSLGLVSLAPGGDVSWALSFGNGQRSALIGAAEMLKLEMIKAWDKENGA